MPSEELARRIRQHAVRMCATAQASHIGSSLSVADILAVLYSVILRIDPVNPRSVERDRLIFSKGHAAAALYSVLAECGFFELDRLETYCQNGSQLTGHVSHAVPGVEVSTGSLGHGLPIGCGLALSAKRERLPWRVFVVLSDGELDEGSTWEAALFAGHHRLGPLTAIVDYNKIQSFGAVSDVLDLEPLVSKWQSFGWAVVEVDGHNHADLCGALKKNSTVTSPLCVIAHTVKGKGVSYMEGQLAWHYCSPNAQQLATALTELSD